MHVFVLTQSKTLYGIYPCMHHCNCILWLKIQILTRGCPVCNWGIQFHEVPPVQRELWWLLVVWLSFSLVAEHCWLRSGILSLSHGKCSLILSFSLFLSAFWLFKLYYSTVESFGTVKHYKFIHVQGTVCSMPHIELQRKPMGNTLASWQWCLYCHYTQWNLYIDNGLSHCDVSDLWNLSSKKPCRHYIPIIGLWQEQARCLMHHINAWKL